MSIANVAKSYFFYFSSQIFAFRSFGYFCCGKMNFAGLSQ